MNLRSVYTIAQKELLETLRDKRTLFTMIGIPVLLYPLLFIAMSQVAMVQKSKIKESESKVAINESGDTLREWIGAITQVQVVDSDNPQEDLKAGELDAVVIVEGDAAAVLDRQGSVAVRIQYERSEPKSSKARRRIADGLKIESDRLLGERLDAEGLVREFAQPIEIKSENVETPEKKTASVVGGFLPMIMIVMLGMGAFYPAIDLTAGEKERGTYETLLSTPTSKVEIVTGKFLTVCCISLITGLLNLGSMVATIAFQLAQLPVELSFAQLTVGNTAMIFLVMVPLAFCVSAVMMSIALTARDFKEAQNFITPFFLLIMIPAMIAMVPGIELSRTTVFIPIGNVALLFKDLMMEQGSVQNFFIVFFSTGVYALLSLILAVWLFQREEILLAEEKGIPFSLRRSDLVPRSTPTVGLALFLFSLTFLLVFYLGTYVQSRQVIVGLFITEWCLLLLPTIAILWYVRVDLRSTLGLSMPPWPTWFGTLLMAAGMMVLVVQVAVWQNQVLPIPERFVQQMTKMFQYDGSLGLVVLLLASGVSPAICEEVLFRGAILSGLRTRLSPVMSVLVVGVLFGLFHMSIYRVLPTALLGLAITYVVVRCGSIYPGILFHFLVNVTAVLVVTENLPRSIRDFLEDGQIEQNGLPAWLLLTALLLLVAGIVVMETTKKRLIISRSAQDS